MTAKLVEENLIAQVVAKLKAQQATIDRLEKENESLRARYEMALSDVVKGNIREVQLQRDLRTANEQAEYWQND